MGDLSNCLSWNTAKSATIDKDEFEYKNFVLLSSSNRKYELLPIVKG